MGGINSYTQILMGGGRREGGKKKGSGWKSEGKSRERYLREQEECYLAPEIFNELYNKTLDPGFNEKSEVFSIGMTLLRTIVGEEVRNCYDWNEFKFIPSTLSSLLSSLPVSFSTEFSSPSSSILLPSSFLDLLKGMLAINPNERLTLSQLHQKLKIYNQTIQELEGGRREEEEEMKVEEFIRDEGLGKERRSKGICMEDDMNEERRNEIAWLYREFGRIMEEGRKEEGRHYSKEVLGVRKALMEDDYLECSLRREEVLRRSMVGREERGKRRRKDEDMIGGREIYDLYLQEYEILKSQG